MNDYPTMTLEITDDERRLLLEACGMHRAKFINGYAMTGLQDRLERFTPAAQGAPESPEAIRSLKWAVSNCHQLAMREIRRLERGGALLQMIERWQHVKRICEIAGAQSPGVLRDARDIEYGDSDAPEDA